MLKKTVPTLVKVHRPNLVNKKNNIKFNKLNTPKRQALKRNYPNRLPGSQWLERKWPEHTKIRSANTPAANLSTFNKPIACQSPSYIPRQKKSHLEKNRPQFAVTKSVRNLWTTKVSLLLFSQLSMIKLNDLFDPQPKKVIISSSKLYFLPEVLTMPNDPSPDHTNKAEPDNVIPKRGSILERLEDKMKMWSQKQQAIDAALEYDRVKAKKIQDEADGMCGEICDIIEEIEKAVDQQDHKGRTALHIAVEYNCLRLTKALLELGANREIRNNEGKTPLEMSFGENNHGNALNAFRIKVKLVNLAVDDKDWTTINKLIPSLQQDLASYNPENDQKVQTLLIKSEVVTVEEYQCIKDYVSQLNRTLF